MLNSSLKWSMLMKNLIVYILFLGFLKLQLQWLFLSVFLQNFYVHLTEHTCLLIKLPHRDNLLSETTFDKKFSWKNLASVFFQITYSMGALSILEKVIL